MNIVILGAAGFIGTNLAINLAEDKQNRITLVDKKAEYFSRIEAMGFDNINIKEADLDENSNYDELLENQDIVYHLISTIIPATSNNSVLDEITINLAITTNLLDACVYNNVNRVIFLSSGGVVYGKNVDCPINEKAETDPINSYGIQKLMVEKLLYLYYCMHNLDYRIIRLANPYGPYQNPHGQVGALTKFIYKALKNEGIEIFGDGSVVRDFIYIDDAVNAIVKIANNDAEFKLFNVGSGVGTSITDILAAVEHTLRQEVRVMYKHGRTVDVPINYLDISRYNESFGEPKINTLAEGIMKTADFMKRNEM